MLNYEIKLKLYLKLRNLKKTATTKFETIYHVLNILYLPEPEKNSIFFRDPA